MTFQGSIVLPSLGSKSKASKLQMRKASCSSETLVTIYHENLVFHIYLTFLFLFQTCQTFNN
jgi:hypothetical protein